MTTTDREPRERAATCTFPGCGRETWHWDARCDRHPAHPLGWPDRPEPPTRAPEPVSTFDRDAYIARRAAELARQTATDIGIQGEDYLRDLFYAEVADEERRNAEHDAAVAQHEPEHWTATDYWSAVRVDTDVSDPLFDTHLPPEFGAAP